MPIAAALAVAVASIITGTRTVITRGRTAAPVRAAAVIDRSGVDHRGRHIYGRRTVIHRWGRRHIHRGGRHVHRGWINHAGHAD
ncbi:hypothetical protein D3C78_1546410 [compost metagenome]